MTQQTGQTQVLEARYYNCNYKGIAIIAVITKHIDWSAYIGADNGYSEQDCINWTQAYGAKLSEADAKYYFPYITLPYRH